MKKLSLSEFKGYYGAHSFDKIIFTSANQSWNSIDSTSSVELVFKKMIVTFNPNIIYLKGGENTLRLNRVKAIRLHDDDCLLGKVFTVVCGDSKNNFNDKEYTLIAS